MTPLLTISGLTKSYGRGARRHLAIDGVSLELAEGEILGLVGESGSGKSTTLRCLMGLETPDAGTIKYADIEMPGADRAAMRRFRSDVQMVFQDPYSSLDPRMRVGAIVAEPLRILRQGTGEERRSRAARMLTMVGMSPEHMDRYPRSFSGGQRQRIAIARALVAGPRILVCDEPVSSLDVSVQAQVLNLLRDMRGQLGISILFVAHDLAVVRYLCDRVTVMERGRIVETATTDDLIEHPREEYTRALLEAAPQPDPRREREKRELRLAARRARA